MKWIGRGLLALIVVVLLYQLWLFGHVWWWVDHNPAASAFMEQQLARLQESDPDAELRHKWVPYGQVSPNLKRALIASEVCLITRADLMNLVQKIPRFKDFYIRLLEWAISGIDSSRHDLVVLNAEQRYEKMLHQEPHMLQQIPLQHLASMLGVTPRHLSRIRKNIR